MLSVIIRDNLEPNVIKLTYENLHRELKNIAGAELLVGENWFDTLSDVKNGYVCFVEPDCLVSSGYFSSQIGLFKKNAHMRKLAMLSSAVGLNNWANRIYGYKLGNNYSDGIIPIREQVSRSVYPVEMGFVPGAIIRVSMLKKALKTLDVGNSNDLDLVHLSAVLSLEFWKQGDGNRVHINPNTTYVTTEDYAGDIADIDVKPGKLVDMFRKESI